MNRLLLTVVMIVAVGVCCPASAQTNNEVNAGIQFDFSLPGARSLGLGGAFVAVADDATAAWSNPAGLTILNRKEVSGEVRLWRYNNQVTARGMAFGSPTGIGVDSIQGLQTGESADSTASPAFVSVVIPGSKWSLGIYRHQLSNYKASVVSDGPFLRVADYSQDPKGEVDRVEPFAGDMTVKISDFGAALGVRLSEQFSVGASLGLYQFSLDSTNTRASYVPVFPPSVAARPTFTAPGQRFGPADFSAQNISVKVTQTGDDHAVGVNIGALWRASRWSLGAAFRQGPKFTFTSVAVRGPAAPPEGTPLTPVKSVPFHAPDVYALGGTFRPMSRWLVSFEYDRTRYSQLSEHGVEVLGIAEVNPTFAAQIMSDLRFPDVNQLRFGTEYVITQPSHTLLFRLGSWIDPDHRLKYFGDQPRLQVLYRAGDDQVHVAPGFGIATSRVQFDGAVDISNRVNTVSFSTVFRF